ncbi:glycoside hydrolase, partial [Porticoccaceae bacterium]|nr:glycoside hydrolase [Porticoccaceae bacterium]
MQRYFRTFTMMIILLLAAGSCAEQSNETRTLADWSSPAGQNSVSPNLSLDLSGSPILSWMKVGEKTVALEYSRWEGSRWSSPVTVAKGDNWLVNRADFPSVVQLTESLWASHWLVMTDPNIFAYDVAVSLSTDGGVTWGAPLTPHTDGTFSEHGFVSFFVNGDDVGAVWLDGREMVA